MRVGALPICGMDDKLKGVLTDRDVTVKVLGKGVSSCARPCSPPASSTPHSSNVSGNSPPTTAPSTSD